MVRMDKAYDEEVALIQKVGIEVQRDWREVAPTLDLSDTKSTAKKLNEWTKKVESAFERVGFRAAVDVNPIYGDMPPDITILERMTPIHGFDFEKQAAQIRKSKLL